ncbi:putative nitrate assimilation regulatory protein nira protein [Phaeoacremonium minimum UCRPA7]|uniref:Putative nitrate assimilation regulatory protein nira protein n=1 Tax=Phaeoacremonium minimum (strain UCR-PA7) TaxID=1286976 RepID=R8BD89_PHAM7|nr:putative nitrate assimilation regulatory protein nira protein [Phaeoacremonium minimum UCRPA7]EON97269.1 putative nitrate assimilation regulatory protein nira protein [Phaeoacremonium minimum UCRPA7]
MVQEAAKTRLETLEKLFASLQTTSPTESERLVQRIRTGENLSSIVDDPEASPAVFETLTEQSSSSGSALDTTPHLENLDIDPLIPAGPVTLKGKTPVHTVSLADGAVGLTTAEVPFIVQMKLPTSEFVRAALEAFFSSTGKLFQFFSREQAARYYDMVFDQDSTEVSKVAVCCVALVAAMGLQYEQSEENASREKMDGLYNVAKHYYEAVLVEHPLDAIKVCGLLAMFNIFDKVTISLAYIGMTEKVALTDFDVDNSTNLADLVQSELTKISILKADILRLNLLFKDLSFLTIETILLDLREWHAQLPSLMHLHNVQNASLPWNLRLTIYHVHLLYLGAFMLLYRRIASQIVKNRGIPGDRTLPSRPSKELVGCAEEGVLSAKSTARILGTLMADNGVFKKCWLVIYQAYTACTVVLYSVAQKQLHFLTACDTDDDLECARICLSTLEYCGSCDPVAAKFHAKLSSIYQRLTEDVPTLDSMFQDPRLGVLTGPSQFFPRQYLLRVPEDGNPELMALALDLLVMLCKPFGGLENKKHVDDNIENAWKTDPTRYEHPQLIERLEWNVENSVPFHWDMGQLGSGSSNECHDTRLQTISCQRKNIVELMRIGLNYWNLIAISRG